MEHLRNIDKRVPKSGKYLKQHGYFDEFISVGTYVKKRSKKRFENNNYVEIVTRLNAKNPFDPRGYAAVELSSGQIINTAQLVPCEDVAPDHLYEDVGRGWAEYLKRREQ